MWVTGVPRAPTITRLWVNVETPIPGYGWIGFDMKQIFMFIACWQSVMINMQTMSPDGAASSDSIVITNI